MGHPEVVGLLQRHAEALEREARGEFVLPPDADRDTEFDSYDDEQRGDHEYDNLGFGAPMTAAAASVDASENKVRKFIQQFFIKVGSSWIANKWTSSGPTTISHFSPPILALSRKKPMRLTITLGKSALFG